MKRHHKILFAGALLQAILVAVSVPLTSLAGPATENAGNTAPGITLRNDAPVYTGPVEEGDLEELTMEDFQEFGVEPEDPADQYRQYRKLLEQPPPGILIPYKMRVVDRDLALDDFLGFDVPEEVSEARYDGYLSMNPATEDGHTIHYVYVYHGPLVQKEVEFETTES